MLQNTKLELGTTAYQDYLNHGGQFTFSEYQFVIESLENCIYCPKCPRKKGQILDIAKLCGVEVTSKEVAIYTELRKLTEKPLDPQESVDFQTKSACCMSDIELVAEIFLLSDESKIKTTLVKDRFPTIFETNK